MNIQPVFNEYEAISYMCSYFSKSEDQYRAAIMQAAKKAYENKLDHFETMKNIVKAYTRKKDSV